VFFAYGLAIVGNILPVVILLIIFDKISTRKPSSTGSAKRKKAEAFFEKWGVRGLAMVAPILTGVYIATAVCAYFSVPRAKVLAWMTVSIVFWGAIATGITAGFLTAFTL